MAKTTAKYKLFSASSAFFIWGGWTYCVNSVEDKLVGLVSGLTQGVASFLITLVVVFVVKKIYNALSEDFLKIIVPAIVTVSCVGIFLTVVHSAVGTPRITPTIAPSLSVAFLFSIFTAYKIRQNERTVQV